MIHERPGYLIPESPDKEPADLGVQPQGVYWQCVLGPVEGPEEWPEDPPIAAARAWAGPQGSWHPVGFAPAAGPAVGICVVLWARAYTVVDRGALAQWKASRG